MLNNKGLFTAKLLTHHNIFAPPALLAITVVSLHTESLYVYHIVIIMGLQ